MFLDEWIAVTEMEKAQTKTPYEAASWYMAIRRRATVGMQAV